MIDIILWYIWIGGRAYLGVGLLVALLSCWAHYRFGEELTLGGFISIIFFHPIVVYYFIKELENNEKF